MNSQLFFLILTWLALAHQNPLQNPSDEENKIVINLNIDVNPGQTALQRFLGLKNGFTKGRRLTEIMS